MATQHASSGFMLPPGGGESINVVGESIRILADGAVTGGRCLIFEDITQPNCGPPLHRHGVDDECFYVIEGRFRFVLDGKELTAEAGAFVFAPRGSLHTFANVGSTPGRMLIVTTPSGLEAPFRETHAAAQRGPLNPEILGTIFGKFDLTIHGPPLMAT